MTHRKLRFVISLLSHGDRFLGRHAAPIPRPLAARPLSPCVKHSDGKAALLADANNNRLLAGVGVTSGNPAGLAPPAAADKERKKERRHRSRRNRDKERRDIETARALQNNGERLANLDISKESRNRREGSNEIEVRHTFHSL